MQVDRRDVTDYLNGCQCWHCFQLGPAELQVSSHEMLNTQFCLILTDKRGVRCFWDWNWVGMNNGSDDAYIIQMKRIKQIRNQDALLFRRIPVSLFANYDRQRSSKEVWLLGWTFSFLLVRSPLSTPAGWSFFINHHHQLYLRIAELMRCFRFPGVPLFSSGSISLVPPCI
jgi:hypothetical protein